MLYHLLIKREVKDKYIFSMSSCIFIKLLRARDWSNEIDAVWREFWSVTRWLHKENAAMELMQRKKNLPNWHVTSPAFFILLMHLACLLVKDGQILQNLTCFQACCLWDGVLGIWGNVFDIWICVYRIWDVVFGICGCVFGIIIIWYHLNLQNTVKYKNRVIVQMF